MWITKNEGSAELSIESHLLWLAYLALRRKIKNALKKNDAGGAPLYTFPRAFLPPRTSRNTLPHTPKRGGLGIELGGVGGRSPPLL